MKTLLHVGCGLQNKSSCLGFDNDNWKEVRFDIDENVNPDIVGTLTDMKLVESASYDAIYSAHNIEHIFPHEVPIALKEFSRVLKDDGMVVITCPDLQSICEVVSEGKLLDSLYESSGGPISPIDSIYGWREPIQNGNLYMAHKCGFTYSVLDRFFFEAGFKTRVGGRRPEAWDLYLVAFKQEKSDEQINRLALPFIPKPQFTA
jgi:SAM-dependent methyltransferase